MKNQMGENGTMQRKLGLDRVQGYVGILRLENYMIISTI